MPIEVRVINDIRLVTYPFSIKFALVNFGVEAWEYVNNTRKSGRAILFMYTSVCSLFLEAFIDFLGNSKHYPFICATIMWSNAPN
jgi:hypothetical protein